MKYFNDRYLPEYVFTKKFDKYLFLYHPEFFGVADKFIEVYVSVLKKLKIDQFMVSEVLSKTNEVKVLKEYDINQTIPAQIYKDLFGNDVEGISYMTDVVGRAYFTVSDNPVCVFIERDLEAVVIACSEEVSIEFLKKKEELGIWTLGEFLLNFDILYKRHNDEQWFIKIKSKLLENYS